MVHVFLPRSRICIDSTFYQLSPWRELVYKKYYSEFHCTTYVLGIMRLFILGPYADPQGAFENHALLPSHPALRSRRLCCELNWRMKSYTKRHLRDDQRNNIDPAIITANSKTKSLHHTFLFAKTIFGLWTWRRLDFWYTVQLNTAGSS